MTDTTTPAERARDLEQRTTRPHAIAPSWADARHYVEKHREQLDVDDVADELVAIAVTLEHTIAGLKLDPAVIRAEVDGQRIMRGLVDAARAEGITATADASELRIVHPDGAATTVHVEHEPRRHPHGDALIENLRPPLRAVPGGDAA